MKTLDFNKIKKEYLTVTLNDEKSTTIMVGTPGKALMTELMSLQEYIKEYEAGEVSEETLDNLYIICAKVMSRNKANVRISKEQLEEIFDIEDIIIFFNTYLDYIKGLANSKN